MSDGHEDRDFEMLEDRLHDLRAAASDVRLQSYRGSDQGDVDTVVHMSVIATPGSGRGRGKRSTR